MRRVYKYSLVIFSLSVALAIALTLLVTTSWGLSLVLSLASNLVPGKLSVQEQSGKLIGPLHLGHIEYRLSGMDLRIKQLDLDWHSKALLSGELNIINLQADSVDLRFVDGKATNMPVEAVASEIMLPIDIVVTQANISNIKIQTSALASPISIDKVSVSAVTASQSVNIKQLQVQAFGMHLQTAGDIALQANFPLKLATDYTYQLDKTVQLRSKGNIQGDLKKLHLTQQLSGLLQAGLDGEMYDLQENLTWQAALQVQQFNPKIFGEGAPDVATSGTVTAKGDLAKMAMQAEVDLNEKQTGVAKLHIDSQTDLTSMAYHFILNGGFTGIDLPQAQLALRGTGDLQSLSLSKIDIQSLQGGITGDGTVTWLPQFTLNASLAAQDIQPELLSKDWPGKLNASVFFNTELDKGRPRFVFDLKKLDGELRGYPVRAHARGSLYEESLAIDALNLFIEESQLSIHGELAKTWDMSFSLVSPNLKQLLPDASGKLELHGRLSGSRPEPRIVLSGSAESLVYARESIKSLQLQVDAGLASTAPMQVDILAQDMVTRLGKWQTAKIQTRGNNKDHDLSLQFNNETDRYFAAVHAGFSPWHWQGQIEQLKIEHIDVGAWSLKAPADFSLKQGEYVLKPFCLLQNGAYLCSEIDWKQKHGFAKLDGKAMPLALLQPWLPANIKIAGELDLLASIQSMRDDTYEGMLTIHSADKDIVVSNTELNEQLILAASVFKASFDSQGLQASLRLPLSKVDGSNDAESEGGGIEADIQLVGWSPERAITLAQALQGRIRLDRIPAKALTRFAPNIGRAQGYLVADFKVQGTLGEPQLQGTANWRGGNMTLPELGISLRDIELDIQSRQTNTLIFQLHALSGEGELSLRGQTRLDSAQGWPTQVHLQSKNLEAVNIPEAYVLVDSEIEVAIQGVSVNITGELRVPRARLRPRGVPEGVVGVSRDVVIIHAQEQEAGPLRWLVSSKVRVILGELVDFDGFGVNGKLRGNLLVIDEPGKLPIGQGELSIVDGSYRLRGQDLKIRRGRLLFANTFIDDPGVDVDAVRELDEVTVGVKLQGTLKHPTLSVFSEPTMSETDALSYLILGHAASQSSSAEGDAMRTNAAAMGFVAGDILSQEIGGRLGLDEMRVDVGETTEQTALVMGKYLSPKLYVRYFSGIVESSNIVQLRYQLSKRFRIQTEGGYRDSQSVTGGDIFFTIEY